MSPAIRVTSCRPGVAGACVAGACVAAAWSAVIMIGRVITEDRAGGHAPAAP
jgi:hypothetical protein